MHIIETNPPNTKQSCKQCERPSVISSRTDNKKSTSMLGNHNIQCCKHTEMAINTALVMSRCQRLTDEDRKKPSSRPTMAFLASRGSTIYLPMLWLIARSLHVHNVIVSNRKDLLVKSGMPLSASKARMTGLKFTQPTGFAR